MSGSVTRSSSLSGSPKNVKEGQVNKAEKTSSCEIISEVTTSDTVSAIQHNAHWKENDFCHDFTDPQIDHDRILLVGGKDLHVISNILMETSDFFKILFGENFKESNQEKIELKEVEAEDFIEFLNHLYSNNRKITKDNFFPLFTLADRFLTPLIFKKCSDFIKEDPNIINDFGQRAFDLLKMAIDTDLKNVKAAFKSKIFTSSLHILCKKCKRELVSDTGIKYHDSHNGYGLYMTSDHLCMLNRDYILTLPPKSIAFILESLVESLRPNIFDSYDEGNIDENAERDFNATKLFTCNFANKGPYHNSTIIFKDLVKDTEQIFNVNSKIVCSGAKWFRGRLEKGSQLVLTDVSAAHFELFLNFIYPNGHQTNLELSVDLLEMSARFECPCLYRKSFNHISKEMSKVTYLLDNDESANSI